MQRLFGQSAARRGSLGCAVLLAALLAAGCGGSDAETVGCDFFSNDNCWTQTVAEAYKCIDATAEGQWVGNRTECIYPDGTSIKMATAVPDDIIEFEWEFDIIVDGTSCASVKTGATSLEVTTGLGTFSQTTSGLDLVMSCPDGGEFEINGLDALECDLSRLPGYAALGSGGSVRFSLLSSSDSLLSCSDVTIE